MPKLGSSSEVRVCVAYRVPLIAIWLKSQVRFKILCEAAFIRDRQLFACAAFVRTTVVTIIPSPLQHLHGFGYNGLTVHSFLRGWYYSWRVRWTASHGTSPCRLLTVLDSTVRGVNPKCNIPECISLPMASDVRLAFMPEDTRASSIGASFDFKAARKQIQGLWHAFRHGQHSLRGRREQIVHWPLQVFVQLVAA